MSVFWPASDITPDSGGLQHLGGSLLQTGSEVKVKINPLFNPKSLNPVFVLISSWFEKFYIGPTVVALAFLENRSSHSSYQFFCLSVLEGM